MQYSIRINIFDENALIRIHPVPINIRTAPIQMAIRLKRALLVSLPSLISFLAIGLPVISSALSPRISWSRERWNTRAMLISISISGRCLLFSQCETACLEILSSIADLLLGHIHIRPCFTELFSKVHDHLSISVSCKFSKKL